MSLARTALAAALLCAALPAAAHGGRGRYVAFAPPAVYRPLVGGALRVGVDTPGGWLRPGERLRDELGSQLGIQGELGVRVAPQLLLGGYVGGGFGSAGPRFDAVCAGADCRASTIRGGLLAHYDLAPWAPVSPWISYGFGLAASWISDDLGGAAADATYVGLELARLGAGIDFRPGRGPVAIGLFVDWSLGVYRSADGEDGRAPGGAVHHWLAVGPRLSF
jgi:hypothetical protein